MRVKTKYKLTYSLIIILASFLINHTEVLAAPKASEVDSKTTGVKMYTYKSSKPPASTQTIIFNASATNFQNVYFFIHGDDDPSPTSYCSGVYKLCERAKSLPNSLFIGLRMLGNSGSWHSSFEFVSMYNEAKDVLSSLGKTMPTNLNLVAFSRGGSALGRVYKLNQIPTGVTIQNTIFLDACFAGGECSVVASLSSSVRGKMFMYASSKSYDNGQTNQTQMQAATKKSSDNITYKHADANKHNDIPTICFMDHTNNDSCEGKAIGAGTAQPTAVNTSPGAFTQDSTFSQLFSDLANPQQTDSDLKRLLQQPNPRIKIPGLSFSNIISNNLSMDTDGGMYISFPFLGEYISAIYKYAIVIAGIVSVILLVVAGIEWMMTGENIERAKKKIQNAIIGLILSVGSYTILYAVNPELVNLRSLKVRVIPGVSFFDNYSALTYNSITGKALPTKEELVYSALQFSNQEKLADPCFILVILKTESGANPKAIGHDENYSGPNYVKSRMEFLKSGITSRGTTFDPPFKTESEYKSDPAKYNKVKIKNDDEPNSTPPDYGLDWRFGHGFGAGQITMDGFNQCNGRGIKKDGKCYNIPDLLNSFNNLNLTAKHIKINYDHATKLGLKDRDLIIGTFYAYAAGNKGLDTKFVNNGNKIDESFLPKKMANYDQCKKDTQAYIQGITGITPAEISENFSVTPDLSEEET